MTDMRDTRRLDGELDPNFGRRGVAVVALPADVGEGAFVTAGAPSGLTVAGLGHLVAVGFGSGRITLVRCDLRTGAIDATFGSGGHVVDDFSDDREPVRNPQVHAVAVSRSSKIVVAGWGQVDQATRAFILARYLPDGRLDPGFGRGGHVVTRLRAPAASGNGTVPVGVAEARAVAIDRRGRIVAAGAAYLPPGPADPGLNNIALVRYLDNGSLDRQFGVGGMVTRQSARGSASALAFQPDGKIVATGGLDDTYVTARFHEDGSLDEGFGRRGVVADRLAPLGSVAGEARAHAVVVQPDGRILVSGTVQYALPARGPGEPGPTLTLTDIGVARYAPDGRPDRALNPSVKPAPAPTGRLGPGSRPALTRPPDRSVTIGGRVLVDLLEGASSHATDPGVIGGTGLAYSAGSGTIVVGGTVRADGDPREPGTRRFFAVLARLRANGQLDEAFGDGGRVAISGGGVTSLLAQPVRNSILDRPGTDVIVTGHTESRPRQLFLARCHVEAPLRSRPEPRFPGLPG